MPRTSDGVIDACTDRQLAAVGRGSGVGADPEKADKLLNGSLPRWRNCRWLAKSVSSTAVAGARGPNFIVIVVATRATMVSLRCAVRHLIGHPSLEAVALRFQAEHYAFDRAHHRSDRAPRVRRRGVPADEKVVSLFETPADIIVKGGRDTHYGH